MFNLEQYESIANQYTKLNTYREHLKLNIEKNSQRIDSLKQDYEDAQKARLVIIETAQEIQTKVQHTIGDLVTMALEAIFPEPYKFTLDFVTKRNHTECEIWLERGGERSKPVDSVGGGVLDIMSLACRIAFWVLEKPRGLLVLDETCKFVSADYRPLAAEMIRSLAGKLDLQVIMTTHLPELFEIADTVVEL